LAGGQVYDLATTGVVTVIARNSAAA